MPLTPEKAGESRPGPEGKRKRNGPDEAERRKKEKEIFSDIVGVFNGEGPPVPIPNTEVKLTCAEDTCLATDWENRSMPTQKVWRKSNLLICLFSSIGRARGC